MYAQDYDEVIVPWTTQPPGYAFGQPAGTAGIPYIWMQFLEPYVKSGSYSPTTTQPAPMFTCPSFDGAAFARGMDTADCDGNGTAGSGSTGWAPPSQYGNTVLSHYGIAFNITADPTQTCTAGNPYYDFPGSGPVSATSFYNRTLASIESPARTANIGDGITELLGPGAGSNAGYIGITFGCESQFRHKGGTGSNFSFLDGHSKWVHGNIQRHEATDSNGCVYMEYLTGNK